MNFWKNFHFFAALMVFFSLTAGIASQTTDNPAEQSTIFSPFIGSTDEKCPDEKYLPEDPSFSIKAIHCGYKANANSSWAIIPPIHLTSTYRMSNPKEPLGNFEYTRTGNPDRAMLENYLAVLDGGKHALAFSSGIGAVSAITQLLRSGDHIICTDSVYGGTQLHFKWLAEHFDLELTFHDFLDLDTLTSNITSKTKLIWLESPSNPLLKILDVPAIVKTVKAKNNKTLVAIDNTFLSPFFQRPLNLGVDIVMYSLTKYMNGHSDVLMGGAVMNDEELYKHLKNIQSNNGAVPSPFDCYLVLRGLKTLKVRMKEHMANGLEIARFLSKHPAVQRVYHPGLETHPNHCLAKKQWSGYSGMLSFNHTGDYNDTMEFIDRLKFIQLSSSLGGFESLIAIPSMMSHASVPEDIKQHLGITDNFVRMSVGLESVEDLKADLQQALDVAVLNADPNKLHPDICKH